MVFIPKGICPFIERTERGRERYKSLLRYELSGGKRRDGRKSVRVETWAFRLFIKHCPRG